MLQMNDENFFNVYIHTFNRPYWTNRNRTAKPSDQNRRIVDDIVDDDDNAFLTDSLNTSFFALCKFSSPNSFFFFFRPYENHNRERKKIIFNQKSFHFFFFALTHNIHQRSHFVSMVREKKMKSKMSISSTTKTKWIPLSPVNEVWLESQVENKMSKCEKNEVNLFFLCRMANSTNISLVIR